MAWYRELFTNFARNYDKETFTQGTAGETDFFEQEIGKNKAFKILDIGCGTGRHAIELAKRGYKVTGIDLSPDQISFAMEKAMDLKNKPEFIVADARIIDFEHGFDLAIMICEGGFSLQESDQANFEILEAAKRSLKPGGKFIFTCLNALFPLHHSTADFINANDPAIEQKPNKFDLMTFRDYATFEVTDDSGVKKSIESNERYWAPSEINWMLKSLGFENIGIYGCDLGSFSRDRELTIDDFEMLVVAESMH